MDFRFSPEDEAFRQEVRDFVRREWDPKGYDLGGTAIAYHSHDPEAVAHIREWEKKLAAKGWWAFHWPVEFGGTGAPISRQLVYREEMAYRGVAEPTASDLVSGVLMYHGNDWHKKELLPSYARAEIDFCRALSEPSGGTDLANLQTSAVRDGDDFVITGQKTWSSNAHRADYAQILVRTDPDAPRHRGLTYFIMDMKSPGVVLRPIKDMMGRHSWDEIFLDKVRVPGGNMVGELNRGWYATMTHLSFERSNIAGPARMLRVLEEFMDFTRETRFGGRSILENTQTRHQLADLRIQVEVARMMSYWVAWMQTQGEVPVKESSLTRLWSETLTQGSYRAFAHILGGYGLLMPEDPRAPGTRYYGVHNFLSIGSSIGAGPREIQKNIIAQRGLGLPR